MSNLFATITTQDYNNSLIYAQMRLLKEKTDAYNKTNPNVVWQDAFSDGRVTYGCPVGLTGGCVQGYTKITNMGECISAGPYTPNDPNKGLGISVDGNGNITGSITPYYLEWRNDIQGNGNCYLGNWAFRDKCVNGIPQGGKTGLLNWDPNSNSCVMTKRFCDEYGFLNYEPGSANPPSGDGGSCELNAGQYVASLFGTTFSRGLIGKGCFKN
jgi:hypothetical protein